MPRRQNSKTDDGARYEPDASLHKKNTPAKKKCMFFAKKIPRLLTGGVFSFLVARKI
jgi:hypothetical protein